MVDLTYPNLLQLFPEHRDPKRSESASFLIWYLENYYRLDTQEAVDSVCDQRGDKGVDGIFVNDGDSTITVFQGRISQAADATIGDKSLREFAGTLTQFASTASIEALVASAGEAQVASLIKRLDLANKINTHELRGEFLSNSVLDANGADFLRATPLIQFVGKTRLESSYISDERARPVRPPIIFDIFGFPTTEYVVDANTKAVIVTVKALDLVTMDGIADQSLYAYNVRGPLGRTQVNRDIVKSIKDQATHRLFPLFHNGVTVICGDIQTDNAGSLMITDYFVVNGCQSLTALYNNRKILTDDLRILTKFIRVDPDSQLAGTITQVSNNQNGVKARDFMSNNAIQIRLQNEMRKYYAGQYDLEIKRGEQLQAGTPISNELAGLHLMAFDLKEPWGTTRRYEVFEEKHADLFGRPEVTADRIVMLTVMADAITEVCDDINNTLFGRYVLTRYFLLYCLRLVVEQDELAMEVLTRPSTFVRGANDRKKLRLCIESILDDMVIDLNAEVDQLGEDFDYRDKLRNADWVRDLGRRVVSDYTKLVKRGRIQSFSEEWNA